MLSSFQSADAPPWTQLPCLPSPTDPLMQVETAGDCYIAAGGLTLIDEDGFTCIDPAPDPVESARRVLSFAKVRGRGCSGAWLATAALGAHMPITWHMGSGPPLQTGAVGYAPVVRCLQQLA